MKNIEVYTRPGCGYCVAAKALLEKKEIPYQEYNTLIDNKRLKIMRARAPQKTFPQVVINDAWIGGFEDLLRYDLTA